MILGYFKPNFAILSFHYDISLTSAISNLCNYPDLTKEIYKSGTNHDRHCLKMSNYWNFCASVTYRRIWRANFVQACSLHSSFATLVWKNTWLETLKVYWKYTETGKRWRNWSYMNFCINLPLSSVTVRAAFLIRFLAFTYISFYFEKLYKLTFWNSEQLPKYRNCCISATEEEL